jgi:hypothetical protein
MPPLLLVVLLVAALIALIPVWRLHAAGWPARWLALAWFGYAAVLAFAVRAPAASRFLVPMLVVAFVAPFVAGPERLARVLRGRRDAGRPVINVTPRPPAGLSDGHGPASHGWDDVDGSDPDGDGGGGDGGGD